MKKSTVTVDPVECATVTIPQDTDKTIKLELATAIVALGRGVQALFRSGLNERAIVCLLHDASGVGKPDIRRVITGLLQLEQTYCMPVKR